MKNWWNWLLAIALICMLFIAIPLSYSGGRSKQELKSMYDEYIAKFNKSYKNNLAEYETRLQYFEASMEEIDRLNSEARGPEQHRARYGLTRLSDMSKSEYRDLHLSDEKLTKSPKLYGKSWKDSRGYERDAVHKMNDKIDKTHHGHHSNNIRNKRATFPLQVDWRAKGTVGPVRDQGLCGACWAFSTVGAMESMAAIGTGKLVPLSVQEVIDCAGLGNNGCAGGDICLLLDWLSLSNTAVETEKEYPLKLINGVCRVGKNATGVRVSTYTCDDFVGAEEKILQALATHGPVAVAVNALTWQNYLGGVIQYHCSGSPADLNHAIELVGYDLTKDVPYYIAKNSWGTEFGNGGYLHLAVGSNICGLAVEVATVDVK